MSMVYENSELGGLQEPQMPRANQACSSCRRQKRKCSKSLPACELCQRMNRHCDYSNASPAPTSEDFNALRLKLMELESRVNIGGNGVANQQTAYTPSSSGLASGDNLGPPIAAYTPQDIPWQSIQNRFPAIAFLDKESFKYGGISVPKPSVDIPVDVLELIGDGSAVHQVLTEYFATVHKWMPIVSQKRMSRNMVNPMWEGGPDLALLFLCMKLIISRPQDGLESSQNPIYISAKRFIAVMEAAGTASLLVLQANVLVTWYEYGQAIYPAAYMSAGWCIRYANMLGINGNPEAPQLLGAVDTWLEQEERRRTWWGVLLADRIVSLGSQSYILNAQEPPKDYPLPASDNAWDSGEMSAAHLKLVSAPLVDTLTPFPRLCQAYILLGKVLSHHQEHIPSETARFGLASQLALDISLFIQQILVEASISQDYLSCVSALALSFSAICAIYDRYCCPSSCSSAASSEASAMQVKCLEGLKSVSRQIVEFAAKINAAAPSSQDLDKISPIVMDALYSAAANSAWQVRESGDESYQIALDAIRHTLRRLGIRWRNAAEYLRILEAQEFSYAVGSATS